MLPKAGEIWSFKTPEYMFVYTSVKSFTKIWEKIILGTDKKNVIWRYPDELKERREPIKYFVDINIRTHTKEEADIKDIIE